MEWGREHGPLPIVEISDLEGKSREAMLLHWSQAARPHPPDPQQLLEIVPADILGCPRLLQMLLGQWLTAATRLDGAVRDGGLTGVVRLILDGVCQRVEGRGSVNPRRDLQVLADVLGGLRAPFIPLEDVNGLAYEGFVRSDLEALSSTGVVEVLMAKGDRTVGALSFTHPLFQEVLLAEFVVVEIIQFGLRRELEALVAGLAPAQGLAPYNRNQALRLLEMADHGVRELAEHLRPILRESLESWLWNRLRSGVQPQSSHYPRLVGTVWLVSEALNRAGTPHTTMTVRLVEECQPPILAMLAAAGEAALAEAVARGRAAWIR
jgi:hypothetical protein